MKRRISLVIIAAMLIMAMSGVCGCSVINYDFAKETETIDMTNDTATEISLNDRQKEILSSQGLSTEYKELTASQQKAIVAIEEMLQAVEVKYNAEFAYSGYTAGSTLEDEQLWAYPVDGDKKTESFVVTRDTVNGTVKYYDTYLHVAAADLFSGYVASALKDGSSLDGIKVYSEITELALDSMPSQNSEFDGCTEASIWIFIDSTSCTGDKLSDVIREFEIWMEEHQVYGSVQYILLKEDVLPYLTKYNYTNYLSEEYDQSREYSYINK